MWSFYQKSTATNGHTKSLSLLLETADDGNIVDCTDLHDRTPLMLSVEHGHVESTVYLIRNNAIVNARDTDGRTALHRGVSQLY